MPTASLFRVAISVRNLEDRQSDILESWCIDRKAVFGSYLATVVILSDSPGGPLATLGIRTWKSTESLRSSWSGPRVGTSAMSSCNTPCRHLASFDLFDALAVGIVVMQHQNNLDQVKRPRYVRPIQWC